MGFDEFVADRLDGLLRYATVLTDDPHLAQDIVQDVLLRAQQRWTKIEAPATYVRRMVTNEYLSWRRRAVRRMISLLVLACHHYWRRGCSRSMVKKGSERFC